MMSRDANGLMTFVSLGGVLLAASLVFATPVQAGDQPPVPDAIEAEAFIEGRVSSEEFLASRAHLIELFDNGQFGHPSASDRARLQSAYDRMVLLMERGGGDASGLNPRDRVALFNAQERFDTVLADYADPMVCRRERRTGSQMVANVCERQSVIDARREGDQEGLRSGQISRDPRPWVY